MVAVSEDLIQFFPLKRLSLQVPLGIDQSRLNHFSQLISPRLMGLVSFCDKELLKRDVPVMWGLLGKVL
jgi:hypothetical protein